MTVMAAIGPWAGLVVTIAGILYLVFGPISKLQERVRGVEVAVEEMDGVPERVSSIESTHIQRCLFTDSRFNDLAKAVECLVPMKIDIAKLVMGVESLTAFAESLDAGLIKKFHSPHPQWDGDVNWQERDGLLEKMEVKKLTVKDCTRLEVLIEEMAVKAHEDVIALSLLLGRVQMIKRQLELKPKATVSRRRLNI
jgi:hypothetical protein